MKIGHLDTKPVQAPSTGERKAAPASQGQAEPSAKVELSSAAAVLGGGSDGDFDGAKVERIAQAIRDGKFEVHAEVIADKLIANARELLAGSSER